MPALRSRIEPYWIKAAPAAPLARDSQINTAHSAYRLGSVLLAAPSRSVPAHSDQTPGQYAPRGCPPGGRPFAVVPSATWGRMTREGAKPPTRRPPECRTPAVTPQGRP